MDKDTDSNNSSKINISTTSSSTSFATSSNTGTSTVFSNRTFTGTTDTTNTSSICSDDAKQLTPQHCLANTNCSSSNLSKLVAAPPSAYTVTTTQAASKDTTSHGGNVIAASINDCKKNLHKITTKHINSTPAMLSMPNMVTAALSASQMTSITSKSINLNISTTTGGNFQIEIDPLLNVESLKKIISKKLKVAKDRICLLHREKKLESGSLHGNNLTEGSKIILIPNVETGLLAQRPENTVMQALESLNDCQVNDFLSGKTPLNLSMRLGDHMMLIQLQLSTVNPGASGARSNYPAVNCNSSRSRPNNHHRHHHSHNQRLTESGLTPAFCSKAYNSLSSVSRCNRRPNQQTNNLSSAALGTPTITLEANNAVHKLREQNISWIASNTLDIPSSGAAPCLGNFNALTQDSDSNLSSILKKGNSDNIRNIEGQQTMPSGQILQSLTESMEVVIDTKATNTDAKSASNQLNSIKFNLLEQSPIKSLSNLVSSPIKTTAISHFEAGKLTGVSDAGAVSNNCISSSNENSINSNSSFNIALPICQDPIAAKLTSCLCTRLGDNTNQTTTKSVGSNVATKQCIDSIYMSQQQQCHEPTLHSNDKSNRLLKMSNAEPALDANSSNSRTSILHRTTNNSITRKHRNQHHNHQRNTIDVRSTPSTLVTSRTSPQNKVAAKNSCSNTGCPINSDVNDDAKTLQKDEATSSPLMVAATLASNLGKASMPMDLRDSELLSTDSQTLAEASRNLTQTLRQLSKEVFTNKINFSSNEEAPRKNCSGAVIESMKNHGKGIYSGTFSGTLNPALQDRYGRPKRDISTVIHILNDLLSATPHYGRGARISLEAPNTSRTTTTAPAATNRSIDTLHHSSRGIKHLYKQQHLQSCAKCTKARNIGGNSNSMLGADNQNSDKGKVFGCAYSECSGHYVCSRNTLTNLSMDSNCNNTIGKSCTSNHQAVNRSTCCQQDQSALTTAANDTNQSLTSNIQATIPTVVSMKSVPTTGVKAANTHPAYHHYNHYHQRQMLGNHERKVCQCRFRVHEGSGEKEYICLKCSTELDNMKTKSKLDHLRLVMQQRKQKREARRLKGAPYPTSTITDVSTTASLAAGMNTTATSGVITTTTVTSSSTGIKSDAVTSDLIPPASNPTSQNTPINVAKTSTTPTSEVSPNHMVEEVDTAA